MRLVGVCQRTIIRWMEEWLLHHYGESQNVLSDGILPEAFKP
jgi:hypothetical protein